MQSSTNAIPIVVDTNVLLAGLRNAGAANRLLAACIEERFVPLVGAALLAEYEDVLHRDALFRASLLNRKERDDVLDAFLSVSRWIRVYYAWRPNLPDEADNHLVELAIAGNAPYIVTRNFRDFTRMELKFPQLQAVSPAQLLEVHR